MAETLSKTREARTWPCASFDPAKAETWLARGRNHRHAHQLAEAWTLYPDLPASAVLDDRIGRMRDRATYMRPIFDDISETIERERKSQNFAFTDNKILQGRGDERDNAIILARDRHQLDWNEAIAFADGYIGSRQGWQYREDSFYKEAQRIAYQLGFSNGGGDPTDLFDAARRALIAEPRAQQRSTTNSAIPSPSSWPRPTDEPRPTSWNRRLFIVTHSRAFAGKALDQIAARPGTEELAIIILGGAQSDALEWRAAGSCLQLLGRDDLRTRIIDRDIEDILIDAEEEEIAVIDALRDAFPVCKNMERTRNTALQRRGHLSIWLDRGMSRGEAKAAGHIRWGKAIQGLTGRLGEFTASYEGGKARGIHEICVRLQDGELAEGFLTPAGQCLAPRFAFSNRSKTRSEMASLLRQFGAATRL